MPWKRGPAVGVRCRQGSGECLRALSASARPLATDLDDVIHGSHEIRRERDVDRAGEIVRTHLREPQRVLDFASSRFRRLTRPGIGTERADVRMVSGSPLVGFGGCRSRPKPSRNHRAQHGSRSLVRVVPSTVNKATGASHPPRSPMRPGRPLPMRPKAASSLVSAVRVAPTHQTTRVPRAREALRMRVARAR